MSRLQMTVNGQAVDLEVPESRYLATVLREDLRLTGTHIGCNEAECGICTVLVDGQVTVRDSLAIMAYLERAYPQPPLFGSTLADAAARRARAHGACTRAPKGLRIQMRQSPNASRKRSMVMSRSVGNVPVASDCSSR